MRRRLLAGPALVAAVAAAIVLDGGDAPSQSPAPLLGIVGESAGHEVARVDARTLRPLAGSRAPLGEFHDGWSRSPDGTRIAFAISSSGRRERTAVRIVSRRTLEATGELEAGAAARVLGWLGDDRIAALTIPHTLFFGDMRTGRRREVSGELVLWDVREPAPVARRPFGFPAACAPASAVTRAGFAALVTGAGAGAPPRLALVDADGRYRTARLPGLPTRPHGGACGGLVVDPSGDRVHVVTAGTPTAEIDLDTLAVRSHRVRAAPATRRCAARPACAPHRRAVTAGPRRLAVSGHDGTARAGASAGARLLDLRAGTSRTLDPGARDVLRTGATLLTYGRRGVRAFGLDGRPRWRALRGRRVRRLQVARGRAYAHLRRGIAVLDPATGRIVHRSATAPREVELLDAP